VSSATDGGGREGSLEAPTRHPLNWRDASFYDEAALDQELLLSALLFEGEARQFAVKRDGDHRGHQEDQQHGVTRLAPGRSGTRRAHPAASSCKGRVCSCLNWVSSMTTEFTPMRTTR